MVVKLDLEKTYDVFDWFFLKTYLLMFDFSIDWYDRIMNCITTSSFFVLVNDTP